MLDVEAKRELVRRITSSPRFQRSDRLREFLAVVCENHFQGASQPMHEQEIGHRVYGRRADYSPGDDNIVRVEARRLRKGLSEYFESEGRAERVLLSIPKGSYAPQFELRPDDLSTPQPKRSWAAIGAVALLILAVWVAFFAVRQNTSGSVFGIWPSLLNPQQRTNVVVGDASLALFEDMARQSVELSDYMDRRYAASSADAQLGILTDRHLVGITSLLVVTNLLKSGACPRENVFVRHARDMHVRDFQSDNHILIGSRNSNPWGDLFRDHRNFVPTPNWQTAAPAYKNLKPMEGEAPEYVGKRDGEQYGVAAYLPNLKGSGEVLMIEGTSMAGTEAAWAFVNDGQNLHRFLGNHGMAKHGERVAYFEVLLKAKAVAGTPRPAEVVAYRQAPVH